MTTTSVAPPVSQTDWKQWIIDGASRSKYLNGRVEGTAPAAGLQSGSRLSQFAQTIQPLLENTCIDCHGEDTQEGNFRIDQLNPDLTEGSDVDWWVEVLAVVGNGEMPPPGEGDLSDEDRSRIVDWLSHEIQWASRARRAKGGHASFRRLTRYEYNYALQDLLGVPWNFAEDLPPEAHSADGFLNSSETLRMSVDQLETYRRLARTALRRVTVRGPRPEVLYWGISMKDNSKPDWKKNREKLSEVAKKFLDDLVKQKEEKDALEAKLQEVPPRTYYKNLKNQRMVPATWQYYGAEHAHQPATQRPEIPEPGNQVAVLPGARNQKLTVELGDQLPEEGTLRVRVRAARTDVARPYLPSIQLEFGWQASNEGRALLRVSQQDQQISASPEDPQLYQWDIPLGEIYPRNSVRGVSKMGQMPSPSEYIRLVNSSVTKEDIQIDYVEVMAPVYEQWPPASHLRVFPESELRGDENAYARFVLTTFMERAWRRPILDREVERKLALLETVRPQCDSLEDAMIEVLATVLSAPDFLYVNWPGSFAPEEMDLEIVENCELATQLASFLWCSIPDQTLLDLAKEKRLKEPEILAGQVQRMLADSKADRLSEEFVNQWLELELLEFLKWKKGDNPFLKEAMMEEPVEYFQEVLRRNDSVLAFIHSDYAVVNERLARHYGLKDVHGNDFRVVEVPAGDLRRGGLLTQAGVLAMNSDGEQSHPLKRGVWLLENILNDPPPPPPPAVPQIDLADPEIAKMTLKERIEDHRNHAACMACHAKIDPWGIAFENYDEKGKWRDQIQGRPVDASSQLWNQQQLDGVSGLKHYLLDSKQDQFVRAMVAKLSMFALGRPLTFADHAAVDQIASDVRHEGDGLRTLIQKLIASELFLNN